MKKPDFFIVGAPKCGTTGMYTYLEKHPEIFMPRLKEPQFFSIDLNISIRPVSTKEEYLSLFAEAIDAKRIGEASTSYLRSKKASKEIKLFCPNARIIIMLRNPVDMMYALHGELVSTCYEDITNFEEALNAEEKRKLGLCLPNRVGDKEILFYREVAKYTQQIQSYLDVFGNENVHIIIFDDFKKDTAKVYKDTLHFLDVNPYFQPDFKIINPSKQVYSKALQYFLAAPTQFSKRFVNAVIPLPLLQYLFSRVMRLNTRHTSRPTMDPELRKSLLTEFAPEVERLSELIGRDLSHCSKD